MIILLEANVWGTVPDWCMVSVTAVTAFFLFRTLKSQKDVQKTQTELYNIESIRFRESVKPILHYALSEGKFKPGEEGKAILTFEITNETAGIALEIKADYSDNVGVTPIAIPTGLSSIKRHLVKGDEPFLLHFLVDANPRAFNNVVFGLTYQDIAGTKYKQGIYCIHDKHGSEIHPFLPEIVNQENTEKAKTIDDKQ
jgi:hypothetical protein